MEKKNYNDIIYIAENMVRKTIYRTSSISFPYRKYMVRRNFTIAEEQHATVLDQYHDW